MEPPHIARELSNLRSRVPPSSGSRAFSSKDLQELERLTPATLAMRLSNNAWQPADHLLLIALEIAFAIKEGHHNLIIGAPPRHGKSELLSYWTPIWTLDRNPDWPIILTGYGADLVRKFSRRVRDTINYWTDESQNRNYLRCPLKPDSQNVDEWETAAGGGLLAAGIGGPILGKGGKLFIVDDYIKNPKEAESEQVLEDIWEWFRGLSLTRLEPGAIQLIIASRWCKKDLVGRIMDSEPELWKILNFPALAMHPDIAEQPDLLGRAFEQALWPERYNTAYFKRLRKRMGVYFFDAQYQQAPHSKTADSDRTKNVDILDIVPTNSFFPQCRSWDLAASGKRGDVLVGTRMVKDEERHKTVILDVKKDKPSAARAEAIIVSTAIADGPEVVIVIEQEPGSSGKIWAESLKNKEELKGYSIKLVRPTGSKWIRAQPLITAAENGKLELKKDSNWNQAWLDELCEFDGAEGGKDNQVDSAAQGFNYLNRKLTRAGTWGRSRGARVNAASDDDDDAGGKIIVGPTFGRLRR